MKFDLLLEKLFKDLRLALINQDGEVRLGISQEMVKRLDGKFNQLQILVFCTMYDWMVEHDLIPNGRVDESPEIKVPYMAIDTTAGEALRQFSFEDEFDELLQINNMQDMIQYFNQFTNDYDASIAQFKKDGGKYDSLLKSLIDIMLDKNSIKFNPKFKVVKKF